MAGSAGGLVGSIIQMGGAKKAQKAQERSARDQLGLYRDIFDYSKEIQAPFVDAGTLANAALMYELGLGDAPTIATGGYEVGGDTYGTREEAENALKAATGRFNAQSNVKTRLADSRMTEAFGSGMGHALSGGQYSTQFDPSRGIQAAGFDPRGASIQEVDPRKYEGFQKTQDYTFGFNEGQNAVTSSAAARGGLKSGATLKALTEFGQNYASLRRDNYLDRLAGISGRGQLSTNALQNAGAAYAQGGAGALAQLGNAQAAGAIARANFGSQAVQHGFQAVGSIGGMFGGGGFGSIASQFLGGGGFGSIGSGIY